MGNQVNPTAVPYGKQTILYVRDMYISNDATTPNTILDVSAGYCTDSTDVYNINLGNYNAFLQQPAANSVTKINAAVNGVNGLDTGSLGASKVYYVYAVADPVSSNLPCAMISLALPSVGPLLPFGYSVFRHIGYAVTDASSHFLLMYNSGNQNFRTLTFDAPQATAVTAGTSATYAAIDLSALVPADQNNLPVNLNNVWVANAAADTLNFTGGNGVGNQLSAIAGVAGATAHTVAGGGVLSQLVAGVPKIQYKVSAGTVAVNVAGFNYYI